MKIDLLELIDYVVDGIDINYSLLMYRFFFFRVQNVVFY